MGLARDRMRWVVGWSGGRVIVIDLDIIDSRDARGVYGRGFRKGGERRGGAEGG